MVNQLQLNRGKTEVLWCVSTRRLYQILTTSIQLGIASVHPVSTVRDLAFHINFDVTLTTHVAATVRTCFSILRQIRSVRLSISLDAFIVVIRALNISKVDYCCSALAETSGDHINLSLMLQLGLCLLHANQTMSLRTSVLLGSHLHWLTAQLFLRIVSKCFYSGCFRLVVWP